MNGSNAVLHDNDREEKVRYLSKQLNIPMREASILLANMEREGEQ